MKKKQPLIDGIHEENGKTGKNGENFKRRGWEEERGGWVNQVKVKRR